MATHRHLDHDDCYTFSTLVKGFTEDSGPDHFRPFFAKFYALFNHGGYEYSVRVNYRGTGSTFTTHPAADSTPVDLSCRSASGSEAPEKDAGRGGTLQADELVNGPQKESSADKNMSNIVSQADEPTQGAQNAIDVSADGARGSPRSSTNASCAPSRDGSPSARSNRQQKHGEADFDNWLHQHGCYATREFKARYDGGWRPWNFTDGQHELIDILLALNRTSSVRSPQSPASTVGFRV
ncbi:hypothetical protein LTR65_007951 [Meristemomyces frigidus]